MEQSLVIFQPVKSPEKIFLVCEVSMENGNNFPDLIFWYAFW